MSDNHSTVCREGIVSAVSGNRVQVHITVQSACAGCHAKGICASFEMADKEVEAVADEALSPGDRVTVSVEEGVAWRAIFFAFVLPMIFFGMVIFTLFARGFHESVAGIAALCAVGGYFLFLRFVGKSFFRSVVFHARKISTTE